MIHFIYYFVHKPDVSDSFLFYLNSIGLSTRIRMSLFLSTAKFQREIMVSVGTSLEQKTLNCPLKPETSTSRRSTNKQQYFEKSYLQKTFNGLC